MDGESSNLILEGEERELIEEVIRFENQEHLQFENQQRPHFAQGIFPATGQVRVAEGNTRG